MTQMRKNADEIIAKMIGMDNRWGKWEIDHCNGRGSHITNYIDECAKVNVNQWLKESITEESLNKLLKATSLASVIGKGYVDSYQNKLKYEVQKVLDTHIQAEAAKIAQRIIHELREQCSTSETPDREVDG